MSRSRPSGERSKTSSKHDEKESYHCTSLGGQEIQCAHSHPEHHPLPVSLLRLNLISHTLINVVTTPFLKLPSRVAKVIMFCRNCMVMAWRVRGGEVLLSRTLVAPELHYGQISMTQKDGTPRVPRRNAHSRTLNSAWSLLLDAQSSWVVLLVVLGLVRCLRCNMGTKLGRSQLHVRPVGGFSRARTLLCQTPHLPCLDGQVVFGAKAVMEDCTESHQIWNETLGEQSRSQVETALPAAMGPCAPSAFFSFRCYK